MKTFLLLMLFPVLSFGQKKDIIYKKLSDYTCDCAHKKEQITDEALGFCIFEAVAALSAKEKKTINYNENDRVESVTKIAENIGFEMALSCSDVITKLNKSVGETADETVPTEVQPIFTGTLQSVGTGDFKTFLLVGENGEKMEFIWLSSFENDNLFVKNKITKGDKLEIQYREQQFFDPKTNLYKVYNAIASVKLL